MQGDHPTLYTIHYHDGMFDLREGSEDKGRRTREANQKRRLTIWSWGKNVHGENPGDCELAVDLSSFRSEYVQKSIRQADGRDAAVQEHMRSHPDFDKLMDLVVKRIEETDASSVGFVCHWGKHRSMAFAELLKEECYPRAKLKHVRLIEERRADPRSKKTWKQAQRTRRNEYFEQGTLGCTY